MTIRIPSQDSSITHGPDGRPSVEWYRVWRQLVEAWRQISDVIITPQMFGAVGDDVTDDTAAIQAAVDYVQTLKRTLRIPSPPVAYKTTSTVNITAGCSILGDVGGLSALNAAAGTIFHPASGIRCFTIDTEEPVEISRLTIEFPAALPSVAGSLGIYVTGATMNSGSSINNCGFLYCATAIQTVKAGVLSIYRNTFYSNNIGIILNNDYNQDAGLFDIYDNEMTMAGSISGIYGIYQTGGSGTSIISNGFNGGEHTYVMSLDPDMIGGDLYITGNRFEGASGSGVLFTRAGTTGSFQIVTITANEFGILGLPVNNPPDGTGIWLTDLTMTANVIVGPAVPSQAAVSIHATRGFIIAHNTMKALDATNRMILAGATADLAIIGPNLNNGYGVASSILSTNTTTVVPT